eukprot:762708-Hanusia_phi.AAC.4
MRRQAWDLPAASSLTCACQLCQVIAGEEHANESRPVGTFKMSLGGWLEVVPPEELEDADKLAEGGEERRSSPGEAKLQAGAEESATVLRPRPRWKMIDPSKVKRRTKASVK